MGGNLFLSRKAASAGCLALVLASALAAASPAAAFQPLSQLGTGTVGTAAGQLDQPYQVAFDAAGNTFVTDPGNFRISEFAPSGSFVKAFGKDVGGAGVNVCTTSCQAGTDDGTAGSLGFPDGLAIDPSTGDIAIGDEGDERIAVFTAGGIFLRAFGKNVGGSGVNTCTTSCQAGGFGANSGQFGDPAEVAFGPAGELFVGDQANSRIAVLTPSGGFQRAFGANVGGAGVNTCTTSCVTGTSGTAAGELSDPSGVAVDAAGNVFAAEESGNRISVFTSSGTFVRAFGADVGGLGVNVCTASCHLATSGPAAGQLAEPFEVGVDAAGEVLVPEFNNNRVSVFTPAGVFVHAFGANVDPSGGSGFELCTSACQIGTAGPAAGAFDQPGGATADCHGTVYVSDTLGSRVELLGEPGTSPPPCATPAPGKPSNAFSFGKVKLNKHKGTATIEVKVSGGGTVTGSGKNVSVKRPAGATTSKAVVAAGTVKLKIKAKGKAKKKLNKSGKAKVKVKVTFTPTGGDPNSQSKKIRLIKKLR